MSADPISPSGLDLSGASFAHELSDPADRDPESLPVLQSSTRRVPGLIDTFLFFALAVILLVVGELLTVTIGHKLAPFRHEDFTALASDARLMIPSQAIQYLVLLAAAAWIFSALWQQPFWRAIRWNLQAALRKGLWLVGLGLLLGLGTSVAGNYLPMPKEAPILNDLMHSSTGAWLMFFFGTTGAPVIEELAFRGFLLPSLLNFFSRWQTSERPEAPNRRTALSIGLAILLTSAPFALLHSLQVSYAWAPVLLIGCVSVALCLVRWMTDSLAASTLVHATYNFSLFATMLVASDGFRHLEKLTN